MKLESFEFDSKKQWDTIITESTSTTWSIKNDAIE